MPFLTDFKQMQERAQYEPPFTYHSGLMTINILISFLKVINGTSAR